MKHAIQSYLKCEKLMSESLNDDGSISSNSSAIYARGLFTDMLVDYENIGDNCREGIKFACAFGVEELVDNGWETLHGFLWELARNATHEKRSAMLEAIIAFVTVYERYINAQ